MHLGRASGARAARPKIMQLEERPTSCNLAAPLLVANNMAGEKCARGAESFLKAFNVFLNVLTGVPEWPQMSENEHPWRRKSGRVQKRLLMWRQSATKSGNKSANKISQKASSVVTPQDSQRDIGTPLVGFSQLFRWILLESKRSRLRCILLH